MDPIGIKRLAQVLKESTGALIPQTERDLEAMGAALDAAGLTIVHVDDLVQDADKIVEAFPEQWRSLVTASLGLMNHFLRVGTQASLAAQAAQKAATEAQALVADLRAKGLCLKIG